MTWVLRLFSAELQHRLRVSLTCYVGVLNVKYLLEVVEAAT